MAEINFHNLDCMEFMKGCEDNQYDLAIVDPPYGMPKDSTHGRGKLKDRILNTGGVAKWDVKPNEDYFKELFRVSKNQIIWGGNYFDLPPTRGIICWDKVQPWENFSQIEYAWTSFDCPAKLFRFDNRTGEKIHPTQKPVELYRWLLSKYGQAGDKIIDTHGGSMSIAIACDNMGFDLDVCEIDASYFNAGVLRFKEYKRQFKMF